MPFRLPAVPQLLLALGIALAAGATRLHAQASLVILVRHAEKAAPSGDVDLSPQGEARARALAEHLAQVRLDAILVTQYRRTGQTAGPTATMTGIAPRIVPTAATVDAHARAVSRQLDALPPGSAALVVGHSNTLGAIITALGGPALPDLCDGEYATIFVLDRAGPAGPRLLRARFGPADPPGAEACTRAMRP